MRQAGERSGQGAARPPGGEQAEPENRRADQDQPAEELPRRREDDVTRKLHQQHPRCPRNETRTREYRPGSGTLVAEHAARVGHVDGRWRHAPGQVRPHVIRRVADEEVRIGADETAETAVLLAGVRRLRDATPLDHVPANA